MKKIINRKNAAAVACAAMMICAAGAVPDSVLSVSMPAQAAEAMRCGAWAVTVGSAITRLEHICGWYNTALKAAVCPANEQ